MPVISEKIAHASASEIKLYKEGVFWIAYEQSAYYFWLQKGYKPTKKQVKRIGKSVVSIGFPQSTSSDTIAGVEGSYSCVFQSENFRKFNLEEPIDLLAFENWKSLLPLRHNAAMPPASNLPSANDRHHRAGSSADDVISKLSHFPLENKTPMECMLFLAEMKQILHRCEQERILIDVNSNRNYGTV